MKTGPPQAPLRADEGRGDRGEDEHRLQPLAEHEDGRVGDDRGLVRAVAQRGRGVAQRVVEDEARLVHLPARRALGDELREPLLVARAEPDEALDLDRQAGVERLQPPLRPELEERVRLQARLLGLLVLGRADRGLHPVERERDEVVVGLVRRLLPLLREDLVEVRLGAVRDRLHLAGLGDAVLARGRGGHERPQLLEVVGDRLRARGIAPGQQRAEVGERGGRAGAERHGLLDLEVQVDLRPGDAAVVLDRHEGQEAQELLGAARRLGLGERRGGEAVQRAGDVGEARLPRGLIALGGGGRQRVDRGRHAGGRGLAAVLDVARAEDAPVPGRLGGGLRLARREPALRGRVRVVEQLAHAGLVAVEEVLRDGGVRRLRRHLVLAEALDRERRVGAGAREAGRGPEVAQQQPPACDGRLAAVGRRQRDRGGTAQDRRRERAAGRGEGADVAVARRRPPRRPAPPAHRGRRRRRRRRSAPRGRRRTPRAPRGPRWPRRPRHP